jgi:hypothetical protein
MIVHVYSPKGKQVFNKDLHPLNGNAYIVARKRSKDGFSVVYGKTKLTWYKKGRKVA